MPNPAGESSRMKAQKFCKRVQTGATARSRVRAHLRHLEELRREDDAGARTFSRHADSSVAGR